MLLDPFYDYFFFIFELLLLFFPFVKEKDEKTYSKAEKMILTRERHAKHTFTGQNSQQTHHRSKLNICFSFFRGRLDSWSRDCPCRYEHHHSLSRRHSNLICVLGRMDVLGLSLHQMSKSKWRRKETAQVTLGFKGGITKATTLIV